MIRHLGKQKALEKDQLLNLQTIQKAISKGLILGPEHFPKVLSMLIIQLLFCPGVFSSIRGVDSALEHGT